MILLTQARSAARTDAQGDFVALGQQDRALWDAAMLDEGRALVQQALQRGRPGPFQIKAAIAACHTQAAGTDWPQIAALYDVLLAQEPTDVVRLGRAVALMECGALPLALDQMAQIASALSAYQPFHAAHAEALRRSGHIRPARDAYRVAISLAQNATDAEFLRKRLESLGN